MNLSDIIARYMRLKDLGVLSVRIEGESHLLKIYIDAGGVSSLSLGACKNEECLKRMNGLTCLEHFFVKGVKSPAPSKLPLTARLMELLGIDDSELSAETMPSNPGVNIQPLVITDVEEEIIDLIGPIGKMIVDNIFSEISYRRGNSMPSEDYYYLLESLIKELPVQQKTSFSEKFKKRGK